MLTVVIISGRFSRTASVTQSPRNRAAEDANTRERERVREGERGGVTTRRPPSNNTAADSRSLRD